MEGDYEVDDKLSGKNILALKKTYEDDSVYIVINTSSKVKKVDLKKSSIVKGKKLKRGKFLCIPYPKKSVVENQPVQAPDKDAMLTDAELFNKNKKESRKISTIKVALVLPFNTDGTGTRDEQTRMVEYYEGFLMAVDSLKKNNISIDLFTYDSGRSIASITRILNKPEMKNMDVIFGPVHAEQVKPMASFAQKNNVRLVVPFSSKGEEVFNNPFVFQ